MVPFSRYWRLKLENGWFYHPPLFEAPYLPNPCEYLHSPYIARNYIHRTTFPLLTVWSICIRLAVVASETREIMRNSERIRPYSSSRSSKVIDLGVNRKPIYDFLLVPCCSLPNTRNHAKFRENSTLQQFKVIQSHRSWCQSKNQ